MNRALGLIRTFARDIAVVILGVVIALAFNGWAANRADRRLEQAYLSRLERDLRADSVLLASYRVNAGKGEAGALLLLQLLDKPQQAADDTTVARSFSDATRGALSTPNSPTVQELKSTGNLRVIRNARVRDGLLTYYSEIDRLQRSLETVMRRGRDPLAEVGWDIQAFDPTLAYAISPQRRDGTLADGSFAATSQGIVMRYRAHPGARAATARALTYQRFLVPIVTEWESQLGMVRSVLRASH